MGKKCKKGKKGGDFKTSTTNQNENSQDILMYLSEFWKLCTIKVPAITLHDRHKAISNIFFFPAASSFFRGSCFLFLQFYRSNLTSCIYNYQPHNTDVPVVIIHDITSLLTRSNCDC